MRFTDYAYIAGDMTESYWRRWWNSVFWKAGELAFRPLILGRWLTCRLAGKRVEMQPAKLGRCS